jgi:hypothetical protein
VATEAWIESAARGEPATRGGDGFVDRKAHHLLGGAYEPVDGETAAARLLAREDAEVAGWLALPAIPQDAASPLVGLVQRGDLTAARTWIGTLDRAEIAAVRRALKRRREDR